MLEAREKKIARPAGQGQGEDKYSKLFHASPGFIFISEVETSIFLEANEAYCELTGYSLQELIGKRSLELGIISADDRQKIAETLLKNGQVRHLEAKIRAKDGTTKTVLFSSDLVEVDGRQCLITSGIDITEHSHAQQILAEEKYKFQAVVHQMTEGLVIFDPEGNLLDMNPAALKIHGFDRVESIQRHLETLTDTFELFDLKGNRLPTYQWPIGMVLRGETFDSYTVRVRRCDTGKTWIGSYGGTPVYDQTGRLVLAVVTLRDVTERFEFERALAESRAKLEGALNSMTDAVLISDAQGRFIEFNDAFAKFHRFKNREECAKTFAEYPETFDVFFPDGTPVPVEMWAVSLALRGESASGSEYTVRRKDTGESWVGSYSFAPISDPEGKITGTVVVARDITAQKKSEEELRHTHAILHGIADGAEDMIAAEDQEFRYLFFNEAYRREFRTLWGRDIEAGTNMAEALSPWPEEQRKAVNLWSRALAGESFQIRMEFGSERDRRCYDLHFSPIHDDGGRQIGAAHILRNVTEQVRMQQALARSEERYRSLFTNMTEGFALGELIFDEEGRPQDVRFLEVNDAFEKQTGLSREIIGQPLTQALPELEDYWVQTYLAVAFGGKPVRLNRYNRDTGRWYDLYCFRPAEGKFAILFWDITLEREATETLRESEERFRTLADGLPLIVWVHDHHGEQQFVNLTFCDFFGVSREEMKGENWKILMHPDDADLYSTRFLASLRDHKPFHGEVRVKRTDGEWRWIESWAQPRFSESGEFLGMIGTSADITDRKQTEREIQAARAAAEEANQAKSEFLANMSHEIRTPMTVFMAAIEHLLLTDRNPDRRHLLGMADASAKRLRSLIDDILDFSRIEARKVEIDEEPFDLRRCVREAVEMFTLPAREKDLKLEMDVAATIPEKVIGDPNRVGQVLINLIGNAVKFTREGEVRVRVEPRGDLLEFSVADTGIGIPETKQHLLFQSFSQVDMSFHRQHGGSGLGLAISKGLVELMGGEISLQSREGQGSVFTFTLPLKATIQRRSQPCETASVEIHEHLANLRILLADDEPMIREMVTMMLQRRGMQTKTAENGRDALRKWEEERFDLILMDLQMPEMSGMEATRAIREKEKGLERRTCVVGLTAHVRREVKEDCLASGMDRVLIKPVQMKDLFTVIDDCFSG